MTTLLQLEHLSVSFPAAHRGKLVAVDDVDLHLDAGEVVGLIGESGCGKSTLARTIVRLHQPSAGRILFEGNDVGHFNSRDLRAYRKRVQYIFQDPYSSLNPRYSVRQTLTEALTVGGTVRGDAQLSRAKELIGLVGLSVSCLESLPSALSGGQRQRIAIARALALEPRILICDEPVSALDVSIRAQIMNLLLQLRKEFNLAYLFIGHDLPLVRRIADRITVMYLGAVVEEAPSDRLFDAASHPYTRALIAATPTADPELERMRSRVLLSGELPRATAIPSGCRFHPRCPQAFERCPGEVPRRTQVEQAHVSYCHLAELAQEDIVTTQVG